MSINAVLFGTYQQSGFTARQGFILFLIAALATLIKDYRLLSAWLSFAVSEQYVTVLSQGFEVGSPGSQ